MDDTYKHSIRMFGGFHNASFGIVRDAPALQAFFSSNIFSHLETRIGSVKIWEGFISEMELQYMGVRRRISVQNVRNAVNCIYTDTADDVRKTTSWYTNDSSIEQYGRMEETVYLDNVELTAADAYAQTVLAEMAWPYPEVVSIGHPTDDLQLHVTATGYAFTGNNQYITVSPGSNNISTYIVNTINADCEFLNVGSITTNTVQVDKPINEIRAWDWMMQLSEIGDGTDPYLLNVQEGQHVNYNVMNPTPVMGWRLGRITGIANTGAIINKWMVQPGVIRDFNWPSQPLPAAMFLTDARDSIITEIEVSEAQEMPAFKTDLYEESDFIAEMNRNLPAPDEND
jgi:hypothetical protein